MRQILLGQAPLGQGGAVGSKPRFGDPPYYLVNDTFTTDLAAGAVNGTDAEPGPGRRVVVDTNSKLSLSGGSVSFATGGSTNGNPGLWLNAQSRAVGRLMKGAISTSASTMAIGWDFALGGQITDCIRLQTSSTLLSLRINLTALSVGLFTTGVVYEILIAMRSAGMIFFINGGAYSAWTLLYSSDLGSGVAYYPAVGVESSSAVGGCAYIKVPAARWLPAPLCSDGFGTTFGSSDGLGHAEGIAGGLGSGGSGLAWTQHVGVWSAAGGVATSTLVAGRALASVDCGTADVLVSVKLAVGANSAAISARYVDESNRIELRHTGAAIQFVKVIAGVSTTLINTASTFVAGAELRLSCIDTKFRVYYNNAFIGAEQTIADAAVASATRFGLRNTDVTNTFDDFVVYAIGTGGEYAVLDTF